MFSMKVDVRVFATLRRYLPDLAIGEPLTLDVPEVITLDEIREQVGLPRQEVKVYMRNNRQANPEETAEDGDRITFIPAVAGG